jgi:hypothetical protein
MAVLPARLLGRGFTRCASRATASTIASALRWSQGGPRRPTARDRPRWLRSLASASRRLRAVVSERHRLERHRLGGEVTHNVTRSSSTSKTAVLCRDDVMNARWQRDLYEGRAAGAFHRDWRQPSCGVREWSPGFSANDRLIVGAAASVRHSDAIMRSSASTPGHCSSRKPCSRARTVRQLEREARYQPILDPQ